MEKPELTIAIHSYKSPELLKLSLRSVKEDAERSGMTYEILVSDSATDEDTEMLMREDFPEVRFFPHAENVGFAGIVNTSLQEARGDYLFLLNADIVLAEGVLQKLFRYLQSHPEVGLLGPKQLYFNGTLQLTCLRFYRPLTVLLRRTWLRYLPGAKRHLDWFTMADYDRMTPKEVDWLMGSALATTKQAVNKVGPMDRRFFMYMEDVDWCRRFWENGYKVVYFPDAIMYHYLGKGSARGGFLRSLLFNRLTWYHIESAMKYFWKYRHASLPHHE